MCRDCLNHTCGGCQNRDPLPVDSCSYCDFDIFEGDIFIEFEGKPYHEDCFQNCIVDILLNNGCARKDCAVVE